VVSGSIQDMDRGVIVGRNSYGKGLVQNYFQLPYRTQMKITTARYYTPSGRCIQLLDYRNRNADGSAGKMADSLRKAFKTSHGRTVYDGGGIRPDIEVDEYAGQILLKMLEDERIIFDYANHYRNTHESIAGSREFRLSSAEMDDFIQSAESKIAKILADKIQASLKKTIDDASLLQSILNTADLAKKLEPEIHSRLEAYRSQAEYKLRQQILKRYYSDAALYESAFDGDPDIFAALKVLRNDTEYKSILSP
jgi:carboxyl-terminal processing protease